MSLPLFIAIEAATQDEDSFPVSLAWSLPDGRIKQALIRPEDAWLEEADALLAVPDTDLTLEAYPADEVVREFLYDQEDDIYYLDRLHPQEAWLLKLFAAANQEVAFELVEAASLCEEDDAWEQAYQDSLQFLALDATRAEDQVRALLETHVLLTGEQPEVD